MKKTKKMICALLAAAVAIGSMTGCAGGGASKNKQVTLNFAIPLAEEEWQVFREKVFKPFEEKTGIKVNGIQMENKDMEAKLEALSQAGKHDIDIFAPSTVYLPGIIKKDLAEDLTGAVKIPGEIPENLYTDFQFENKVQFVPLRPIKSCL